MGSLLKYLVILSLLHGFLTTFTTYALSSNEDGYGDDAITEPEIKLGFLNGFFGFPARRKPPPVEQEEEGGLVESVDSPTESLGSWEIHSENAGVSAMHIQLMPNNKVVWHDSTSNGLSEVENNPPFCRPRVGGRNTDPQQDCTAHAIEYDIDTAQVRPLKVDSSPWCSSGGLSRNGNLISTGGDKDGLKSVRILKPCRDCDFEENKRALFANRWYATQHALEDGNFVLVGGRNSYNYEIVPPDTIEFTPQLFELPLLEDTNDDAGRENNLYPFVNLLPDGNLFVFANYKSIILDPLTGKTVRALPDLPGGSRNYPPSGMSALLPVDLNNDDPDIQVLVCGGNTRESYILSDLQQPKRTFLEAARDCGRLSLNAEGAEWEKEDMPSPRVMGDMLLLPTGDVLILNGAKAGTSAWDAADEPNLTPVLYSPNNEKGHRFKELAPSTIPRMYHSSSAVLPDGKILVAGSNTNAFYKLEKYRDEFKFPTELRVEKFSPPYLAEKLEVNRLEILDGESETELKYGAEFNVVIRSREVDIELNEIKVTMYSPPFTTHGYSMNQRLLILKLKNVQNGRITVIAPPSGRIAPPGHYLLFVVHRGVPSRGIWVHIE
ncbi:putative aldehyde oxidase Art an 7 [Salvia miltiorrhiza]|uniref:putative aldehyde oxidase Art an 7 n=1 Tax=Salvia miltiorrhiza TaxID=226208 RepID=UPI0025ACEA46|nr:putative aldehyde oxidase Art an 7 [Salvia miltiorrhiza]